MASRLARVCVPLLPLALLAAGGCMGPDHGWHDPYRAPDCEEHTSCGACTPVLGCGWCQDAQGHGRCLTGPHACARNDLWTWEPTGCSALPTPPNDGGARAEAGADHPVDASDAPNGPDAGVDAADDGASDALACRVPGAAVVSVDAGSADAGTSGCLPSTSGNLCPSASTYTLVCYGDGPASIPPPPATLGCSIVPVPTPSTVLFYCCPCGS